jgi:predicted Zn-dependent protease
LPALAQDAASPTAEPDQVQQAPQREQRRNRDEAFAAHRDAALAAIDKHELAKADAACSELLSEFADHPALAQGLYDIARKHGDVGR